MAELELARSENFNSAIDRMTATDGKIYILAENLLKAGRRELALV